jgi:hypothetical protein
MWDPAHGRTETNDYRGTACYQYMLRGCTSSGRDADVVSAPHRFFFGIASDQFDEKYDVDDKPNGKLPFDEFLLYDNKSINYLPCQSDVLDVLQGLRQLGLSQQSLRARLWISLTTSRNARFRYHTIHSIQKIKTS